MTTTIGTGTPTPVTVTYGYNGFGQRVRRTTGGSSVYSVYDGDDLLLEVSGGGALIREYAHYPGVDQPHSMRDAAGNVYYYSMEYPGHVSGMFNAVNQVVNQYAYNPWGEMEAVTENVQQPFRYMGRELDPITGLYYVRNRWYDPVAARFVSEDPIGLAGGINLYAYAANNPTNNSDPTGLWCEKRQVQGGELIHCEDIAPADFYTIRRFLGGAAGQAAFDMFSALGWTTFTSASCRGGFVVQQCDDLAEAIAGLIDSGDEQCSYLGTRASKRFQSRLYRLGTNAWLTDSGGLRNSDRVGALGYSVAPLSRKLWIIEVHWTKAEEGYRQWLSFTIFHEEAHIRYWPQQMFLARGPHEVGNMRDITMEIGQRCAGAPW